MSEQVDLIAFITVLDEAKKVVELWTGIKAQFIEAGWREHHAEKAVLQLMANAGAVTK